MPSILITILAVLFVLGVAINIHEFGHFIVAKLFGMRVEAYSFFGLGPRLFGFKIGHTDYRVSAIPLGAYVKLYGDEETASLEGGKSKDVETFLDERNIGLAGEDNGAAAYTVPDSELYELRPRWQKFFVMLGGPFMNIMLALAIPFGLALYMGVQPTSEPIVGFVVKGGAGDQAGLKRGDRILSIDDVKNPSWEEIRDNGVISANKDLSLTVQRDGNVMPITVRPNAVEVAGNSLGDLGIEPDDGEIPVVIMAVQPGSAAEKAGFIGGDKFLSLNGSPIKNAQQLTVNIRESKDAVNKITIDRNGEKKDIDVSATASADGVYRIGVQFDPSTATRFEKVGVAGAFSYAVASNVRVMKMTGKVIKQMFSGQRAVKDAGLSGPVGIVRTIASATGGDHVFLNLLMLLTGISLSLGVFNLLPIPMLDGGQIMVLGIEKVCSWFGRTLSMAWRERIQLTGLAVILLLMAFTLFLDISKFF